MTSRGLQDLIKLYPDRVPLIVSGDEMKHEKKLMVLKTTTPADLLALLRNRRLLTPSESRKAHFLIIEGTLPHSSQTIGDLQAIKCKPGEPLKATVCKESTFGFASQSGC